MAWSTGRQALDVARQSAAATARNADTNVAGLGLTRRQTSTTVEPTIDDRAIPFELCLKNVGVPIELRQVIVRYDLLRQDGSVIELNAMETVQPPGDFGSPPVLPQSRTWRIPLHRGELGPASSVDGRKSHATNEEMRELDRGNVYYDFRGDLVLPPFSTRPRVTRETPNTPPPPWRTMDDGKLLIRHDLRARLREVELQLLSGETVRWTATKIPSASSGGP